MENFKRYYIISLTIGCLGGSFGMIACSKAQFGGNNGARDAADDANSKNGTGTGTGAGANTSATNPNDIKSVEDLLNTGKQQPGEDGVLGTSDDYVQLPGKDNQMGTTDDTATFPGPDGKFGTSDDKTVLAGPDGKFGTSDDVSTQNPITTGTENWDTAPCVKGDKVEFQWTGPIKECFDQGKTWDFDSKTCVAIRKAEFTCDWNTVTAELTKADLLTPVLKDAPGTGAKLISCGQSQDKKRIVVQWVKEPKSGTVDCKNVSSLGGVTTGCYTDYTPELPPPLPTDPEEKKRQVYGCLNKL